MKLGIIIRKIGHFSWHLYICAMWLNKMLQVFEVNQSMCCMTKERSFLSRKRIITTPSSEYCSYCVWVLCLLSNLVVYNHKTQHQSLVFIWFTAVSVFLQSSLPVNTPAEFQVSNWERCVCVWWIWNRVDHVAAFYWVCTAAVCAEAYNPDDDDDDEDPEARVVRPKTDEQRRRLQDACRDILLFKTLEQVRQHMSIFDKEDRLVCPSDEDFLMGQTIILMLSAHTGALM